MQVRLLGTLELSAGGTSIPVPGARLRSLLAVLAVRAPAVVTVDAIAAALWGDEPPSTNALQKLVSKLRRTLPDPDALITEATGYRLALAPDALDTRRFEQLVESSRFGDALALWRGEPLADFAYEDWAQTEITRLRELRMVAIEGKIDADLAAGRYAETVAELEALVAEYPLRERLRAQLMRALYGAGRQADALRAFQDARAVLAEELGLEPGPELREVESLVLEQDASLSAGPRTRTRGNLRVPLTPLVGRQREVDAIVDALGQARIVTLVGPGGVGKTRAALEAAKRVTEHFADGAWLAELAAVTDPATLAAAISEALAVPELPATAGPLEPLDRVVAFFAGKDALLVLDNCEHLVDAAATLVVDVAERCPHLRILTTSREALGVPGETLLPVPPLPATDALELFVARVRAVAPDIVFDDETRAVAVDICARLDGLPLALELAAARVRALPLAEVATRLDSRFRLLTGGARTALPRQQTLRAVVDWSYDLLFDQERKVFERLSVFTGGCTLAAAEQVCTDDDVSVEDLADLVARLVDKSLVISDRFGAAPRFRMLQTLSEYGHERLSDHDAAAVRDRHAEYYGEIAMRGEAASVGWEPQVEWVAAVRQDIDNIRSAFEWSLARSDAHLAVGIATGLAWYWWVQGRTVEGVRWLDRALPLLDDVDASARGRALTWWSYLSLASGSMPPDEVCDAAIAALQEANDDWALGRAYFAVGLIRLQAGRRDDAMELMKHSVTTYARVSDRRAPALSRFAEGAMAGTRGDPVAAERAYRVAAEEAAEDGDEFGRVLALSQLAEVTEERGAYEDARAALEEGREAARAAGFIGAATTFTARIGNVVMLLGDLDEAERWHDEALELDKDLAWPAQRAYTLNGVAIRLRRQGRLDESVRAAEEALALFNAARVEIGSTQALATLGFVAEERGDIERAAELQTEGFTRALATDNTFAVALALEGLASAAVARGDAARAAYLLGMADNARRRAGSNPAGTARTDINRTAAAARAALGDDVYDAEFTAGRSADPAEVAALTSR